MTVAALFVQRRGCYARVEGVDPWDKQRDARTYAGPWPVVAHPPCSAWCKLAPLNQAVWGRAVGADGGCFASALEAVRRWGGVLEHPADSLAFAAHGLAAPPRWGWQRTMCGGWVCEVAQSAYGHRARKLTWLYASGCVPPALDWRRPAGTHVVGYAANRYRGSKPRLTRAQASATPPAFRDVLLSIARQAGWP